MVNHDDDAYKLEQLLESLIKMVGKANHNVDNLQKRVSQLEMIIKEQQFEHRETVPIRIYSRHPHKSTENIPFHV